MATSLALCCTVAYAGASPRTRANLQNVGTLDASAVNPPPSGGAISGDGSTPATSGTTSTSQSSFTSGSGGFVSSPLSLTGGVGLGSTSGNFLIKGDAAANPANVLGTDVSPSNPETVDGQSQTSQTAATGAGSTASTTTR